MANKTLYYKWIAAHAYKHGRIYPVRNIVLHSSDGSKAGDIATLTGADVSSHWYITRTGELYHFVADDDTAYHAGKVTDTSKYGNAATIGIEQEHMDGHQDWPDAQIDKAAQLVAFLLQTYNLQNRTNIKTHAEIASPHGRKVDPINYPFPDFYARVDQYLNDTWTPKEGDEEALRLESPETFSFSATKAAVYNRGVAPDTFLTELVRWARQAPDEIFEKNDNYDIYSSVKPELGPWTDLLTRKAAMLEVLRVLGGFESSWNWRAGVNTTNPSSNTPCTEEAGIFQCSGNAMNFDSSLRALLLNATGQSDCNTFKTFTKSNHPFAIEFCVRLLRFTVNHHGPVKRKEINEWLRMDALEEFKELLS